MLILEESWWARRREKCVHVSDFPVCPSTLKEIIKKVNELKNVNEALSKHKRNADDFRKFQEVRGMDVMDGGPFVLRSL